MNIGFVGLGKMGSGIASNLLQAGHRLSVYNRTREKAESLAADGARVVDSPGEASAAAEAVFTMLSDDNALGEVVFGRDGIAGSLPKGSVHLSCSTISTAFSRKLAAEHESRQQEFVSSPVFGRPKAAQDKKLIVLAAGKQEVVQRFEPLLGAIGRRTFVVGSHPWQANAVKLGGNFMIAALLETFGESFALMRKSGIDQHLFLEVMSELFGSPVYQNYGMAIANEKFEPAGFALKLGLKDVRQVIEAAAEVNTPMPFASIVRDNLVSALAHGQEQWDWSSVALIAARNAGLEVKQPQS